MAKSGNQKLKLLYLKDILLEQTDEEHPMTVVEMIAALNALGISAERKSIYDDIEALKLYGLDIIQTRAKTTAYYVGVRDFELPELKLLVDSVQSSKFITKKKTEALIKKIEGLTSCHRARFLQREVYVHNRVKSMNESIYHNVDEISGAVAQDGEISFKYFEFTVTKERKFRKNGERYVVSPFALMWDDENYYMLAYEAESGLFKHYRVDKMTDIAVTGNERKGKELFENYDMSAYSKKIFGMFTGDEQTVRLKFADRLAGAVVDRFGKDVILVPGNDGHFTVSTKIAVSPQFYAWLFGFGSEVEIISPENVRTEFTQRIKEVTEIYCREE